ncbi:tRNA (adenosine(37)-N6)-threonylcarbamoyltransferase complex ATPase subunit type 1 TsaE [Chloroflexota bacterium]
MDRYTVISNSPATTFSIGKRIGKRLKAGNFIALTGELGCGKTLLTRGICAGLEVPLRHVNSPTFAFVNEYLGRLPVFHMDLYRLEDIAEGFEIGVLDYLARAETGIMVVEWAEKILSLLPDNHMGVQFRVLSTRKRQIVLAGFGEKVGSLARGCGNQ